MVKNWYSQCKLTQNYVFKLHDFDAVTVECFFKEMAIPVVERILGKILERLPIVGKLMFVYLSNLILLI